MLKAQCAELHMQRCFDVNAETYAGPKSQKW